MRERRKGGGPSSKFRCPPSDRTNPKYGSSFFSNFTCVAPSTATSVIHLARLCDRLDAAITKSLDSDPAAWESRCSVILCTISLATIPSAFRPLSTPRARNASRSGPPTASLMQSEIRNRYRQLLMHGMSRVGYSTTSAKLREWYPRRSHRCSRSC